MHNQDLVNQLLPLMSKQLDVFQHELGWLLGGTSNLVKHENAQYREQAQKRVDASVQGLLLVYLFAMWEEYVERQVEEEWLTNDELTKLRAFRHIRHSVAHGFDGTRARQCRTEFEDIMNSSAPFTNLAWDNNTINLEKAHVAYDCHQFMSGLSQQLIARVAGNNRP